MRSPITLGINDFTNAPRLPHAIMHAPSVPIFHRMENQIAKGAANGPRIFIDQVHYAAALADGGIDAGPPGPRPHYHPNYGLVYARDPDSNKLQAVCHLGQA